jgi:hypothetical protein
VQTENNLFISVLKKPEPNFITVPLVRLVRFRFSVISIRFLGSRFFLPGPNSSSHFFENPLQSPHHFLPHDAHGRLSSSHVRTSIQVYDAVTTELSALRSNVIITYHRRNLSSSPTNVDLITNTTITYVSSALYSWRNCHRHALMVA